MRLISTCILLISLLWLPECFATNSDVTGYKAIYKVTIKHIPVGTITRELYNSGNEYNLKTTTHSKIPLISLNGSEHSHGIWNNKYPIPSLYSYDYTHENNTKHKRMDFKWQDLQVVTNGVTNPITIGTHDKLSYQLALREDLRRRNTPFTYTITDGRHLKRYEFVYTGKRMVKTPLGQYETYVLERRSKNRFTRLYIAPAADYMIVQAEYKRKGKFLAKATLDQLQKY